MVITARLMKRLSECVCVCLYEWVREGGGGGSETQVGVLLCRLCQRGACLKAVVAVGTGPAVGRNESSHCRAS